MQDYSISQRKFIARIETFFIFIVGALFGSILMGAASAYGADVPSLPELGSEQDVLAKLIELAVNYGHMKFGAIGLGIVQIFIFAFKKTPLKTLFGEGWLAFIINVLIYIGCALAASLDGADLNGALFGGGMLTLLFGALYRLYELTLKPLFYKKAL